MRTDFTLAALAHAQTREAERILRSCVHCGFCTATCPTYVLLGDELDGPRGRIHLIKEFLEEGGAPAPGLVKRLDRCLSCMTTCPSGVDYRHLVEAARERIATSDPRPWPRRALRAAIAEILPHPKRLRAALALAPLGRPIAGLLPGPLAAMLALLPTAEPAPEPPAAPSEPSPVAHRRVALLGGCVQQVLAPRIQAATVRLLTRHGVEVVVVDTARCCGALTHHMGFVQRGRAAAAEAIAAWTAEMDGAGLSAVISDAGGCGAMIKDYGHLFAQDAALAAPAARVAALARDVSEILVEIGLRPPARPTGQVIAYHDACSLQHGQRLREAPRALLKAAGFIVREVAEGHLCCGSAGTYALLEPELSGALRARKVQAIKATGADAVAAGNFGCLAQIAAGAHMPAVHTVELLDWATGGPPPPPLAGVAAFG